MAAASCCYKPQHIAALHASLHHTSKQQVMLSFVQASLLVLLRIMVLCFAVAVEVITWWCIGGEC
jgi:hypothetical protein